MANLLRKIQKVFAENASNNGQFGSLQTLPKLLSNDPSVLQALPAFEQGWNSATISGDKLPALEELQGLQYVLSRNLAYCLNKGIPEWDNETEYFIGDIQREVAGTKIYRSITDNNIGNILTNITHWVLLVDLALVVSNATESVAGTTLLSQQITVANNTIDANNDIDFSAGNFTFSDFSGQAVATAMTKRLDASWVAGTNQGGLDTGVKTLNTWYHMYAIYNPTTSSSDFLFSTGYPTPTSLPTGFTKFNWRMSLQTNGSNNIIPFKQDGKIISYNPVTLYNSTSITTTPTNLTLSSPLGVRTKGLLRGRINVASGQFNAIMVVDKISNFNARAVARSDIADTINSFSILTDLNSQIQHHKENVASLQTYTILQDGWKIPDNLY